MDPEAIPVRREAAPNLPIFGGRHLYGGTDFIETWCKVTHNLLYVKIL